MNFFQAQSKARRSTWILVVLFVCAILGIIALTNLLLMSVIVFRETGQLFSSWAEVKQYFDWKMFWTTGLIVGAVIAGGSLFKFIQLSAGGRAVVESLGGKIIPQDSADPDRRKVLNVVEEMAIASGMAVPPVYLIQGNGINAFAAGYSSNDAVIGITHGAMHHLSRDELQGVIAHEFSHIFNGDMRLNIRLTGILHGVLLLGMIGYYLLRAMRHVRHRGKDTGGAILAILVLALGLMAVGFVGTTVGQLIKAMVSRQREYLADASAVRYTRNRDGIAGALKKIGGLSSGGLLGSPAAAEYSHAYFAEGASSFFNALLSTHPPLKKRIRKIDPGWDGRFVMPVIEPSRPAPKTAPARKTRQQKLDVTAGIVDAMLAIELMGRPGEAHIEHAHTLIDQLPEEVREEAKNPIGAQGIILAMLADRDPVIRKAQWAAQVDAGNPVVLAKARSLLDSIAGLPKALRLPLVDMAMPSLRVLSLPQYKKFRTLVTGFIKADKRIALSEWIIEQLVLHQLDIVYGLRKRDKEKYSYLGAVKAPAELLLSMLAHAEHASESEAQQAFAAGIKSIGAMALNFQPRSEMTPGTLTVALDELAKMKPLVKKRFLTACLACVSKDERVTIAGIETLRTIAAGLDCPLPPVLHAG
ncbi:MAG: M48 family metallopeptidase [Gammaproteobacteria bacterium]|nr:M48 family metallopeptidase [Gammaproteobacteria bacterium]